MIDLRSVVVTGLGTVDATGCGRHSIAAALRDSVTRWQPVDRSAGYHSPSGSRLAGLTRGLDLSPFLPRAAARRMSLPSKLAVAATSLALRDAGLEVADLPLDPPTAVAVATAHGPTSLIEGILRQNLDKGPLAVSPALFTESVANAPAAQIAIHCKAVGPNVTVTQREAGCLIALAQGAAEVALGRAGCALVVAVDELHPMLHAVLDRFGALAAPDAGGAEEARPFDARRDGFVAGEGACALILEPEPAARRRGAKILARLRAGGSAFDPRSPRTGWSDRPAILATGLESFLDRAGVKPAEIGCVVSGACGSVAGDRLEAQILSKTWGRVPLPVILTPKAVTGEHAGGLLAAAVLALEGAAFGPTPGFAEPDPELAVVPHDGRPSARPNKLLMSSLAVGGAAAWAILEEGEA